MGWTLGRDEAPEHQNLSTLNNKTLNPKLLQTALPALTQLLDAPHGYLFILELIALPSGPGQAYTDVYTLAKLALLGSLSQVAPALPCADPVRLRFQQDQEASLKANTSLPIERDAQLAF